MTGRLQKLSTVQLWLLAVGISVTITELIVAIMETLLRGEVTDDYMLTGFVTSLFVAGLVAYFLTMFLGRQRNSNAELLRLAEAVRQCSEVIVLADTSQRIQYVNPAFELLLGYSLEEIQGQELAILLPDAPENNVHPIELNSFTGEKLRRAKNGRNIPVLLKVAPIKDMNGDAIGLVGTMTDLTDIKHVMKTLSESEARFQAIMENMPIMIFLKRAEDLRFVLFNQTGARMVGHTPEDLLGKTDYDFFPKEQADFFTSNDRKVLEQVGVLDIAEEPITTPEGTRILHTKKLALRNEQGQPEFLLGIAEDITERKLTENALRESEEKLRGLYELSPLGIALTDMHGRFVDFNESFRNICGYSEEELKAIDYWTLTPKKYEADEALQLEMLNRTGRYGPYEKEYVHKSGHFVPLRLNGVLLTARDGQQYIWSIVEDITERKTNEAKVWQQANFDPLTQLPNRRLFTDRLEQEIRKALRDKFMIALLFIDLDRFKDVNDTLGHDVGDLLLVEAAARIKHCVRDYDSVARFGGDEFTVMLSELHDTKEIGRIAQNMIDRLSEPFLLHGKESFVSASIGIALYPEDADSGNDLIKHADQAMYAGKNAGRGCFRFFTKGMQDDAELRARLSNDLRLAFKAQQFDVYYQPIIDLNTGQTHKAEALLRWKHPEFGFISPAQFIPIAEEIGIINDIGDWVFMQAAQQVKRWQSTQGADFQISINKSPMQFIGDDRHHNHWIERLRAMDLPGSSIVVEITEGLLMNTDKAITDKLLRFRDAGIQVAIDDFGTGYSSLAYLKKFDIDYLKIDQSFTRNLGQDTPDFALCEAIVGMAHKLGLKVIAEGVETELQRDLLQQISCDFGQGYLFSKPVPADMFEQLLAG